ncbi:uncharacterized protein LOC116467287 [Hylobates moloch]|uniref:uncharacterized protein LOC116467287 n=1 Tax=Hylobates moloch TaxID=81572 RepID=UPI0013625AD3|nr:uncharacterized protein LOC116467287 [Hylobates moloch]XP_058293887.1 uncharacterized protein LOC116467287 [Hylobates moloch]
MPHEMITSGENWDVETLVAGLGRLRTEQLFWTTDILSRRPPQAAPPQARDSAPLVSAAQPGLELRRPSPATPTQVPTLAEGSRTTPLSREEPGGGYLSPTSGEWEKPRDRPSSSYRNRTEQKKKPNPSHHFILVSRPEADPSGSGKWSPAPHKGEGGTGTSALRGLRSHRFALGARQGSSRGLRTRRNQKRVQYPPSPPPPTVTLFLCGL